MLNLSRSSSPGVSCVTGFNVNKRVIINGCLFNTYTLRWIIVYVYCYSVVVVSTYQWAYQWAENNCAWITFSTLNLALLWGAVHFCPSAWGPNHKTIMGIDSFLLHGKCSGEKWHHREKKNMGPEYYNQRRGVEKNKSSPPPPHPRLQPPLHGSVFFKKIKFKVFMRPAICYAAPLSTAHGKLWKCDAFLGELLPLARPD